MTGSDKKIEYAQVIPFDNIREEIERAKSRNRKQKLVQEDLTLPVTRLQMDASYLKYAVYGLGSLLLICIIAAWQLFLHLDNKVEHKMDYLNTRIDGLLTAQQSQKPVAIIAPTLEKQTQQQTPKSETTTQK